MLTAIALGLAWTLDKPASAPLPASLYSFLMWTLPLVGIAFPKITIKQLKHEAKIGGWKVALTAFLNVFGYFLYLKALTLADASRVIPIISSSSTLTILGGIFLLGEKTHLNRKLLAGLLTFIGVILLR